MMTQDSEVRPIVALNLSCGLCGMDLCRSATDSSEHRTANTGIRADGVLGVVDPIPMGADATSPIDASIEGALGEINPRTRRALEEEMNIVLLRQGGTYEVHSESGNVYEVDEAIDTIRDTRRNPLKAGDREESAEILRRHDSAPPG